MEKSRPPKLSPAEAKRKIQLILEDGTVDFTTHCRRRMRERGVDDLDVVHVLQEGQIIREAEWDSDYKRLEVPRRGYGHRGRRLDHYYGHFRGRLVTVERDGVWMMLVQRKHLFSRLN